MGRKLRKTDDGSLAAVLGRRRDVGLVSFRGLVFGGSQGIRRLDQVYGDTQLLCGVVVPG